MLVSQLCWVLRYVWGKAVVKSYSRTPIAEIPKSLVVVRPLEGF